LPSALARGSELRIYSHQVRMYVRACVRTWRGGSRSGMSRGMSLHTTCADVGHTGQGLTHSDTLNSDLDRGRRSLTMEMKVGDDVAAGPWSRLGYYKHLT